MCQRGADSRALLVYRKDGNQFYEFCFDCLSAVTKRFPLEEYRMGGGLCALHRGRHQANDELIESDVQVKQDGDQDEQLGGLHYRDSDYSLLHSLYCGQLLVSRGVGPELLPTFWLHCGCKWSNLLFLSLPSLQFAVAYLPNRESGNCESHISTVHLRWRWDV